MAITNSQYNFIMRSYEKQQLLNHQELLERKTALYDQFPRLGELDAAIASASTACARELLFDNIDHTAHLRTVIHRYSAEKKQILRQAGYPEDYLEMKYRCPDCQDTGYIDSRKCHCLNQAILDLLYEQSNLRDLIADEDFSKFSLDFYSARIPTPIGGRTERENAEKILAECRQFIRDFDTSFQNIFLCGATGLGKTFLSHCIAKELLDSSHSVIYFSAFRLFELLADHSFDRKRPEEQDSELDQHIYDCDFLIIDDLGTELTNTFVASQLFQLINERLMRRKSTLISTNLETDVFVQTYSERVFSRISSNYSMFKLFGQDIRVQKKYGTMS